jgi:hypothetical protein
MKKITELKQRGIRASLREAFESQSLLRLWRFSNEAASFTGYVAGMGKEFLLLWVLGDYIGFDGMYVLRYRDITGMESPDKNAGFLIKAMNLKQVKAEFPKDFVLDDVEGVIKSASEKAPLIAVHVDSESDMEVCYIGRLLSFEPDGFLLQEISPDAEWQTEASFFAFEEVSAVAFDGPYLEVLAQVAGVPPEDVLPFSRDQELVP